MPTTNHRFPPRDALELRLAGALREIGQHAPSAPAVPSSRRDPNANRSGGRDGSSARAWAKPIMAGAAVLAVVGVAGIVGTQQWAGSRSEENTVIGPAESGGTVPAVPTTEPATGSRHAVDHVAARLMAYSGEQGFGKVAVDYEKSAIEVLWKGDPPTEVAQMAGTRPSGVQVSIRPSTYSEAELIQASLGIMNAPPDQIDGAQIVAAVPNGDRSGLIVEILAPWDGSTLALEQAAGGVPTSIRLVDDEVTELGQG